MCNLPNKSKLHIVQLHVVQKYMDIANVCKLRVAVVAKRMAAMAKPASV